MPRLSETQLAQRRERILDAAEICFARAGFHRTTMQDICKEAGVSIGTLYLYFDSKQALIAGISERDRMELAEDFGAVLQAPEILAALEQLVRKHLRDKPVHKVQVITNIWAEAVRDSDVAAICRDFDEAVEAHSSRVVAALRARGLVKDGVRFEEAMPMVFALVDGLFLRRALDPQFDPELGVRMAMAAFRAAMDGELRMPVSDNPVRAAKLGRSA